MSMKRLVSAVLALSLLSGTAAAAAPYERDRGSYDSHYRRHSSDNGAAVVAGIGLLALVAILASQQRHRHHHHGWYNRDGYRYDGYDRSYGRGYGSPYDNNGYDDDQRRR